MKYATIGTSWITQSYIKAANYTGNWELTAVYSRNRTNAAQFAQTFNADKYYTDLTELAADKDIQAVYIASPNALHYQQSKQMLIAGKHVICEKPATVTKEEYEDLMALAEKNGLIFMEAMMSVHVPAMQILKEKLQKVGRISSAHIEFCQLSSKYPALQNGNIPNIFNPDLCTGALMDLGVYNLYLIAELFGKPDSLISSSQFLHTGADHTTSGILTYENMQVTFTCSKIGQGFSQSEIIGDKETIGIDSVSQLTGITVRNAKQEQIETLVDFNIDRTIIMHYEADTFFRCITDPTFEENYRHLHSTALIVRELCDTIRKQNQFTF